MTFVWGHYEADCLACGRSVVFSPSNRTQTCVDCARGRTKPAAKPVVVTHVAGYVPPKGSIAWSLLGNLIPAVR